MERTITVDKDKCIHCGMCIKDCFVSALAFDEEKIPRYGEGGAERCLACQHCMMVCPKGALSFGGLDPENSSEVVHGNADDMLGVIKSRRSVRSYKKEAIPGEKMEKIKEMLAYPPTGGNMPNLHFSIVGSPEKMDEIRKATYDAVSKLTEDSPMFQMKAFIESALAMGNDMVYRGAPSMVVAALNPSIVAQGCEMVDPTIALSYLDLYAWTIGLGTMWDDLAVTMMNAFPEVKEMLEIPEGYQLSFILLLGTPAIKYKRTPQKTAPSIKVLG